LVTATLAVGKAFKARSIQMVGTVMGVILICVWFFVFGTMIGAVVGKKILWPEKGQDVLGFSGATGESEDEEADEEVIVEASRDGSEVSN
jgi:hypothetical protein